jgi:hypothetical protein
MNLKRSRMMKRICFLVYCMVIGVSGFGKSADDTLPTRNSLRFDIVGKAFGGVGVVYERNIKKKFPEKHKNAFTSVEIGISDPLIFNVNAMPGFGISRNWYLFQHKRFIADVGIYFGTKIEFNPTSKAIRDMYKGSETVDRFIEYPFVPFLFSDVGLKMFIGKWFIKVALNPVVYYEKIYAHELSVLPWAGLSFGFKLKK